MNVSHPQSFNRYSYGLNDPINLIDPSGLDPDDHELGHTIIDGGTVTVNGGPDLPDFSALPRFESFDPFLYELKRQRSIVERAERDEFPEELK